MDQSVELGRQLGFWTIIPFALMLLAVAVFPLCFESWFCKNRNKAIVAAVLGVPTLIYLMVQFGDLGFERAVSTGHEYVSFIALLFTLFTISGRHLPHR